MGSWNLVGNLTIRTQILLICLVFSLIIFSMQLIAILVGQELVNKALQNASQQIFHQQTQSFLNNIWLYKHGMEELVQRTKYQISSVRKLNNYVEQQLKNNVTFHVPKPMMCLKDPQDMDSIVFNNSMCCGAFGKKSTHSNKQEANLMIMTSLLDVFRLQYDFTVFSPVLLVFNGDQQITCNSNGFQYPAGFEPFKRPYFVSHVQNFNKLQDPDICFFAGPYTILNKIIRCSITASLVDIDNNLIGVGVKDLDFNYSQIEKHYLQNFTSYILAQDGKVVFNAKYRIANIPVFSLNDTQYSGFTQEDYDQIMLKHHGLPFKSNCKSMQFGDILCLFNSDLNENVIVQTSNITGSPLIMLILSKIDEIQEEECQHVKFLNQKLQQIISQVIITVISASIGIIIIGQIIIVIILRQLNNMILKINNQIRRTNISNYTTKQHIERFLAHQNEVSKIIYIPSFLYGTLIQSNIINRLTYKLINLFRQLKYQNKCEECRLQEEIQYPLICKPELRNLKFIKCALHSLKNAPYGCPNLSERFNMIKY